MRLTHKQLEAIGESAKLFAPNYSIRMSETNMHDGTTISLEGQGADGWEALTVLISRSGQTANLSKLQTPNATVG